MTITSYDTTSEKQKPKKWEHKSPYLAGDKIQLLSKVTGKKIVHKKMLDYVSSFPLAVNIYKTNSDELKSLKRPKKKNKKSVLTLPNNPVQVPQVCTASDMNDSEYTGQSIDCKQPKIKKRSSIKNVRKPRPKPREYEYYDRDARFCSQLNILETSSTDFFKQYREDCKKQTKNKQEDNDNEDLEPHGVWAVLRNMNRFQFTPSPPLSEDSIIAIAKNKKKKRRNRKDGSFIETHTEEYAYISSYSTVDDGNHSLTQSSSFDRLTVINKQDHYTMGQEFQEISQSQFALKDTKDKQNRLQPKNKKDRKKTKKDNNNMKALCTPSPASNEHKADSHNYIIKNCHDVDNLIINDDNIDTVIKLDKSQNTDHYKETLVSNKTKGTTVGCILNAHKSGSTNNEKSLSRKSTSETPADGRIVSRLKGVSRLPLGKTCEPSVKDISQVTLRRPEVQNRKARLVTTMPSACTMPKITPSEMNTNKLLLKYRLPIVEKDQPSSTIEVPNYDPPQFNGLDQQTWPFMVEWNKNKKSFSGNKCNSVKGINNDVSNKKRDYEVPTHRHCNKPKKYINDDMNENKTEVKTNGEVLQSKKKSIALLKDKMLNLLFKKIADRIIISDENGGLNASENKTGVHTSKHNKANINADTQLKPVRQTVRSKVNTSSFGIHNKNTQQCEFSHPWAKAKWANDFVDNVIKKIKNGVYYSQDHNQAIPDMDGAGSIDRDEGSEHDLSPKVRIMKKLDVTDTLPGFENSLPEMEFKILNMNEITVKHCVTNITMQFDVTIPAKPHNQIIVKSTTASNLIPIDVTETHAKVLKCQKTILNAILPAELCSILPKLVKLIQPTDLCSNACSGVIDKCVISPPCLSPIAEASRCDLSCNRIEPLNKKQLSWRSTSPVLNNLLKGIFPNGHKFKINSKKPVQVRMTPVKSKNFKFIELSPELIIQHADLIYNPIRFFIPEYSHVMKNEITVKNKPGIPYPCVALELYTTKNKRLIPAFKPYNFTTFLTNILKSYMNSTLFRSYYILNLQYQQKILNLRVNISNDKVNNVTITIRNFEKDSLVSKPKTNHINFQNDSETKCIEYIKRSTCEDPKRKHQHFDTEVKSIYNKNKRRGFCRMYRKCKSTSNIPPPEKHNTPLDKIITLEDFFQILGTKGMLSSVFDDYAARKILTSIAEMRNWISDINPKQALLVLLLSTKKETPNLVRFRPIILQGIAVNRITKATELDMEIEVIERENLNTFSKYDGITYLPETVKNQNQLLEELYWIAKTTASDYQRPFDESSERLLKSLLEKRRKLNPSYLRVMARYVGLGLLKPPTKK